MQLQNFKKIYSPIVDSSSLQEQQKLGFVPKIHAHFPACKNALTWPRFMALFLDGNTF